MKASFTARFASEFRSAGMYVPAEYKFFAILAKEKIPYEKHFILLKKIRTLYF